MRKVIYDIDINLQEYDIKACMQNDDINLIINIYENEKNYDLMGAKATLNWSKPDGTPLKKDMDINKNIVSITLNKDYTDIKGKAKLDIEIVKEGTVSTFPLCLVIVEKVFQSNKVNNKIVELLDIIKMDEYIDEFLDGIKKKQTELSSQMDEKANKNDVANLSSVTPEFASSIDKMIDTTKTYVNISDGYIYLYNSTTSKFEKSSLQYQATGLNDKSVDITKLEEKIQNKFEKETTETDIIGGELSISKYMINGVDSTSKVVEGNSLAYTTNTTYGTYGWIFENIKGKKYQVISTVENIGNVSADFNFMKAYKAEISGGVVGLNGEIVGEMVTLDSGVSVTKTYIITSDQDETIYKGIALCIKCNINGATLKLTQTVNEINTVTDVNAIKMIADVANTLSPEYKKELFNEFFNNWNGAEVLAIGDSLTSAKKWQLKTTELLGCNITTHAKGGKGYIDLIDGENGQDGDYDNETDASGILRPLSVDDVTGKKLIIVYAGYNERHMAYGEIGDVYPTKNTLAGKVQYVINSIYSLLEQADNLTCKLLFITPHCVGTYGYVNIDGYGEYPLGTGRTLEGISNIIKKVAEYNNIEVLDLWHNSGIGKFTWDIYCAKTPASATAPYPDNVDLVHLNASVGYPHLGTLIANKIKTM
jgi:transcription termination factor NusB|nr:MAG TPA: arylesterase-like protein [Caudoviricetes sp.]